MFTYFVSVNSLHDHFSKANIQHRHTSCDITNCYKEIFEKPIFIIAKPSGQEKYETYYAPKGLNSVSKESATRAVSEAIKAGDKVAVVYSHATFPLDRFVGILQTDFIVPEHKISFSDFFRDTPILVLHSNEDFAKLNEKLNYIKVADLGILDTGFSLDKEYPLSVPRSDFTDFKASSPLFYILPVNTPLFNNRHAIDYAPSIERPFRPSSIAYAPAPPPNSIPSGIGASSPFFRLF